MNSLYKYGILCKLGQYIGDIVRAVLCKLTQHGIMFGGKTSSKLLSNGSFSASSLSLVEE